MSWLGQRRVHLGECASTMDEANTLAASGAPHGTVVTADIQHAGRGRRGRGWFSSAGAVNLSVILRPTLPTADVPPITLAGGIAVCDAVNSFGVGASLKWPNDVMVRDRKLAGVLTEMSSSGPRLDFVIMGIGINLARVPNEVREIACSIAEESDRLPSAQEVIAALVTNLETWIDFFLGGGVSAIALPWTERASLGHRVHQDEPALSGIAVGLDDAGALIVEDDRGDHHSVAAGELRWEMTS